MRSGKQLIKRKMTRKSGRRHEHVNMPPNGCSSLGCSYNLQLPRAS